MQEKDKPDEKNIGDEDLWEKDQKRRGYYYDDAHGYEVFDPENEDNEDGPEASSTNEPCGSQNSI